jgi:glyoxylase-like metal-dependent hydrolase (beta-lactamase superfamily II)
MKKRVPILFFFALQLGQPFAQPSSGTWFTLQKVSDHVFAAIPKKSVRLNSTSTIVVGKHFLTVVEAQSDEHASAILLKQIRKEISTLPVKYLLLTHYHIDHTRGAVAFLNENPKIIIAGSPELYRQLQSKAENQKKEFLAFIKKIYNDLKRKIDTTKNNIQKNGLVTTCKEFLSYYRDISRSKLVLPQMLIKDTLTIIDDSLQIKYFPAGASHSPADMAAYIPAEKILVTGDLVHDFQPLIWSDSNPREWLKTLDNFSRLEIKKIIGGHGRPKQKQVIELWKNYLAEIISLVTEAKKNKITLTQLQQQVSFGSMRSLSKNNFGEEVKNAIQLNMDEAYNFNWDREIDNVLGMVWHFMETKEGEAEVNSE